jgi:hypothetical protein
MEQELGNGWAEGVHPDDFDRCIEIYVSHFDASQSFQMEYRLRAHDGEYHWFIDVGRPRFDGQGEFVGYIGMLSITTLLGQMKRRKFMCLTINRSPRVLKDSKALFTRMTLIG